jgi:uncharacterized protein (DUF1800 family)
METSLSPLPSRDFGPAQDRHLLLRAGFGATPPHTRALADKGPDRAVAQLLDYEAIDDSSLPEPDIDPDVIRPLTAEERRERQRARREGDQQTLNALRRRVLQARAEDRRMIGTLRDWWIDRLIATPRPMQEKLTLLWHGHFATSQRQVRDAYLMYQQNRFFREHAHGSFATLARGIVRDPAMIRYLNNDRNNKRQPNENLARELMELFTLGEGRYTEDDIKQGARALTGYSVEDNDFRFRPLLHDDGRKTILGRTGAFDGDDFVNLLLRRPRCPTFVALKLYRHLVADVSEHDRQVPPENRRVIDALAAQLIKHDCDMKPVLALLLRSRHFYDPAIVGRKIKSPAELLVGTIRQLGTPTRKARARGMAMRGMGQVLFEPPSVAGWPVGREWVNTSTLFVRQNTATYLIAGKLPTRDWDIDELNYDPAPLLASLADRSADAVTNHLIDALLGEHTPPARREPLTRFMRERSKGVTRDSLVALLLLITATPEYQLC